jgi:hypothetical protein
MVERRPSIKNILRIWPWFLIFTVSSCFATVNPLSPGSRHVVLQEREQQIWRAPHRAAEFSDVPHISARARCEDTQPPEALTTPDPLIVPAHGAKVQVSFIVGADGRVLSFWKAWG